MVALLFTGGISVQPLLLVDKDIWGCPMETALAEGQTTVTKKKTILTEDALWDAQWAQECREADEYYNSLSPEEEAAMDAEDYRRAMESLAQVRAGGRVYSLDEILEELRELEN